MRVLILPANNADERHVQVAINLVKGHGHEVVRWSTSTTDSHFDTAIIIVGDHNKKIISVLWEHYTPDEELDITEVINEDYEDQDVLIGKGIYSFIEDTGKSTHLMIFPDLNNSSASTLFSYLVILREYPANFGNKGPAFIRFDFSDLHVENEDEYKLRYGYIDLDCISDTTTRKYHQMSQDIGFDVEENQKIGFNSISERSISTSESIDDLSTATSNDLSLLLLRRVR